MLFNLERNFRQLEALYPANTRKSLSRCVDVIQQEAIRTLSRARNDVADSDRPLTTREVIESAGAALPREFRRVLIHSRYDWSVSGGLPSGIDLTLKKHSLSIIISGDWECERNVCDLAKRLSAFAEGTLVDYDEFLKQTTIRQYGLKEATLLLTLAFVEWEESLPLEPYIRRHLNALLRNIKSRGNSRQDPSMLDRLASRSGSGATKLDFAKHWFMIDLGWLSDQKVSAVLQLLKEGKSIKPVATGEPLPFDAHETHGRLRILLELARVGTASIQPKNRD
jgi:hypothetical protein